MEWILGELRRRARRRICIAAALSVAADATQAFWVCLIALDSTGSAGFQVISVVLGRRDNTARLRDGCLPAGSTSCLDARRPDLLARDDYSLARRGLGTPRLCGVDVECQRLLR